MQQLHDILWSVHSDAPITEPPGLDVARVQVEFDGHLYESDSLPATVERHTRAGRRLYELLARYASYRRCMVASFWCPPLEVIR